MPVHTPFVLAQLAKLDQHKYGIIQHEHNVFLRCPFHGGGNERTGSLKLNTDIEEGYRVGSWVCFGCGEHGEWADFAKKVGLRQGKKSGDDDIFNLYESGVKKLQLIGSDSEEFDLKPEIRLSPDWEPNQNWRGISGKLLYKLKAKKFINKYGERMYLPCFIDKQAVGGITCLLEKEPNRPSYINDPGKWVSHTLFPYDYTRKLLKRYNRRIVMLGEGPRDSLNPLQYGMPALTNLGGVTVWTQEKAELLMTLDLDLLVIATDPDEAGEKLYNAINKSFALGLKTTRLKFSPYIKGKTEKKDPGNMSKQKIKALMRRLKMERKNEQR